MTPEKNTAWATRVRKLLGQGFGVEDIAVKLECKADDVRREVEIYRQEGSLRRVLGMKA